MKTLRAWWVEAPLSLRLRATLAATMLLLGSGAAFAQSVVKANQGQPGNQGPWPVDIGSTTLTTPLQVRLRDGAGSTLASVYAVGAAIGTPNAPMCFVSDGANVRAQLADTSGREIVVGTAAVGAAVAGNPVLVGGSDGTNSRYLSVDSTGKANVIATGTAAAGAAVSGNPVMMGGSDGTNAQRISVDSGGRIQAELSDGTDTALITGAGQLEVTAANALPTAYDWVYATTTDFANCAAGGSSSGTIAAGTWMLAVFDERTSVCYAGTCAAGGRDLPANAIVTIKVAGTTTISCRSAGATGDLQYTKLQ